MFFMFDPDEEMKVLSISAAPIFNLSVLMFLLCKCLEEVKHPFIKKNIEEVLVFKEQHNVSSL